MAEDMTQTTNGHSSRPLNGADPEEDFLHKYRAAARPDHRDRGGWAAAGSRSSSSERSGGGGVSAGQASLAGQGTRGGRSGSVDSCLQAGGSAPKTSYTKHGVSSGSSSSGRSGRELPPVPNGLHRLNRGEGGDGVRRDSTTSELPPRQPTGSGTGIGTARHKASKAGACPIPEVEITIPNDGCLASFSTDAMSSFFRHLRLDDRLVTHLHRNGLDGRKFGRLKDTDLENLRLNNPVIVYFRDRTAPVANKKSKPRVPFVL